jgi:site-specific DNA-methyltransferase (adenine-specific)
VSWRVIEGDCIEVMAELEEASVDAVVTDPPYGLEFMGKEWDRLAGDWRTDEGRGEHAIVTGRPSGKRGFDRHPPTPRYHAGRTAQAWHAAWATAALRVLKPGGHLLSFGGTRTYHRLACALEDAGFEIRDCLAWLYGSGFPKSLDVSKAIDKAAGAEREVIGFDASKARPNKENFAKRTDRQPEVGAAEGWKDNGATITAPATPDAERWQGWGTALKPAFEPIVLARKPLSGTVAENVLQHGTGALNVDGTRIGTTKDVPASPRRAPQGPAYGELGNDPGDGGGFDPDLGRWPANVILDPEAAAMLDEQSGERGGGFAGPGSNGIGPGPVYGSTRESRGFTGGFNDSGGASRFFYTAKTSRAERELGIREYLPDKDEAPLLWSSGEQSPGTFQAEGTNRAARNHLPTVKPVDLMQWLCRLVTPPGGLVLDPFVGSGSTGIAALREGFEFIGIEREPEYVAIARVRIVGDAPLFNAEAAPDVR